MLIHRWQAKITPTFEQMKLIFENEGLDPYEEIYSPQVKITEHRHPFGEVRIVIDGELLFNIAGTQFLLRAGDKVEIPANTKHSHINQSTRDCVCICAQKHF